MKYTTTRLSLFWLAAVTMTILSSCGGKGSCAPSTASAKLIASPAQITFLANNESRIITVTNTGSATLESLVLPTLAYPLESITVANMCIAGESLAAGTSCKYAIQLSLNSSDNSSESLTFGSSNTESAVVNTDWNIFIRTKYAYLTGMNASSTGALVAQCIMCPIVKTNLSQSIETRF